MSLAKTLTYFDGLLYTWLLICLAAGIHFVTKEKKDNVYESTEFIYSHKSQGE